VYSVILAFAVIAMQTSHHVITTFPSILISFICIVVMFKLIGKVSKLDKQARFEKAQREIDEQERRAQVKSFYKK
jgi:amino acid permease